MILGTGCLGSAALDAGAIEAALGDLGLSGVLLVPGEQARVCGALGALPVQGVRVAWDQAPAGVSLAARVGTRLVVLDLGEEQGLDETCRVLFDLLRSQGGALSVALRAPLAGELAPPGHLAAVFEDLRTLPVGYWHRPATAALIEEPEERWLDVLGRWLVGVSLDDVAAGEGGLPPGSGQLDLSRSAALAARTIPVALDVDPVPDVGLLKVALDSLTAAGFP